MTDNIAECILPPPSAPMMVARELVEERYTHREKGDADDWLTLRHWRGGWWRWCDSHWIEVEERAVRKAAYSFTEHAVYATGETSTAPWDPNRRKIGDLLDALAAVCHLPETVQQPAWVDGSDGGVIVACGNGLLEVETRKLIDHTPRYFNITAVPFDYDADALDPIPWFTFLNALWPGDPDSIKTLQEWFGYVVSGRTNLHKIMLLVGPTRGGKGAIARVLAQLIGPRNVAGPTLSSLGGEFGLAPLLGRPLAVISDARLSGAGTSTVVERLLAISGEDLVTVNRKYREQWSGTLPARFMIISNELPHFGDAAGAIVGRFVILLLTRSWLGREDPELEPALQRVLPGILCWALDGLDRLRTQGRFTVPSTSTEAIVSLLDLASPVAAFVRECCIRDSSAEVPIPALYLAWKLWAEENGQRPGTTQRFGRDLRAVMPELRVTQPRQGGDNSVRLYRGIRIRTPNDVWSPQ